MAPGAGRSRDRAGEEEEAEAGDDTARRRNRAVNMLDTTACANKNIKALQQQQIECGKVLNEERHVESKLWRWKIPRTLRSVGDVTSWPQSAKMAAKSLSANCKVLAKCSKISKFYKFL